MMTAQEYRTSKHQGALAMFLSSPAGLELMSILQRRAKPSMSSKSIHGTHEDVKMQMSLNLADSLAKHEMIDFIESLANPKVERDNQKFEPLEDDSLEATEKESPQQKKRKS